METFELIPQTKPKNESYFDDHSGTTSTVKSNYLTNEDIEETQFILGRIAEQILIYTERMQLTGNEDAEAREAVLEIINLAGELESIRMIDEDDDTCLYDYYLHPSGSVGTLL